MRFHPNKRDANHSTIVEHLEKHGAEVVEIFEPLDLLVSYHGFVGMIEVKVPTKRELTTRKQLKFIVSTRFPVAFAKDEAEAMSFLKTRTGLTHRQKDNLLAMMLRTDKKNFTSKDIRTAIEL